EFRGLRIRILQFQFRVNIQQQHMKRFVFQLLLLVISCIADAGFGLFDTHLQQQRHRHHGECKESRAIPLRPHSVTITEFGAVGDGVTVNTHAFQNAIFYIHTFADKGGAQLFVPAGKWLTGSFNLTSHLTLYLDAKAVILGSQDSEHWPVIDPLPSYGRGRELPAMFELETLQSLLRFDSPNTDGIDPDSCSDVCIEDCYISCGDDVISIKSGWDEYGISYGRPSSNIIIRRVIGQSHTSSGLALGSEMSGGIKGVHAQDLYIFNSRRGLRVKTTPGRGGYVKDVYISNVTMKSVRVGIVFTGLYGDHPDDRYDPSAFPEIKRITFKDIVGDNITTAGSLEGIEQAQFKDICLSNIVFNVTSQPPWNCSYVKGFSES
ncbi:hypothetical protein KI387_028091, partial [Taxus chinensis]